MCAGHAQFGNYCRWSTVLQLLKIIANEKNQNRESSQITKRPGPTRSVKNSVAASLRLRSNYARTTWISWKTTHSSVDILSGINRCVTSLPHVSNACLVFLKRTGISSFYKWLINRPVARLLTSEKDLFRRTNVWGPVSQRASAGKTSGWPIKWS